MTQDQLNKHFHDLKNDLTSMTALVNLHKVYKDSICAEELLNRILERQTVIVLAYERLYQENDYPNIGLVTFVNELLMRENRTLNTYCSSIMIKKETADIILPVKKIIPFGQILLELVSNSFRHAFEGVETDKMIEFHITGNEGVIKLEYSDNGRGFAEGFDPFKSRTLGMQFITALSKQLGAKPEFGTGPNDGMSCRLEFK